MTGPAKFGFGDFILMWTGVILSLGLAVMHLFLRPAFAATFEELGGALPALTEVVLSPFYGPLLAVVGLGLIVSAWAMRARFGGRPLLVIGAVIPMLGAAGFVVGAYLPIFTLAGQIAQ